MGADIKHVMLALEGGEKTCCNTPCGYCCISQNFWSFYFHIDECVFVHCTLTQRELIPQVPLKMEHNSITAKDTNLSFPVQWHNKVCSVQCLALQSRKQQTVVEHQQIQNCRAIDVLAQIAR